MASTLTLNNTITWAKKFLFGKNPVIGNNLEPALSSANMVAQTILGPPFTWRWNQQTITFSTVQGTQDYIQSAPTMATINEASIQDPITNRWWEIKYKRDLALDSNQARPQFCSDHVDDGNGNITFRFMPVPDQAYNVNLHCNVTAPLFTSINQTWAPIPDYLSYIYNWGFLALMFMFNDDPRQTYASQQFTSHLLANAEGLTEMERNIFLNNWNALTSEQVMKEQQGVQLRQV